MLSCLAPRNNDRELRFLTSPQQSYFNIRTLDVHQATISVAVMDIAAEA
jgi:hypothetical protein